MKKILIFSHAMELGGAERALLGLLENIDYRSYEVDLFLMRHSGELLKYIPKEVKLLPEIPQYASLAVPIKEVISKRQYKVVLGRVLGKILAKIRVKRLRLPEDNDVALEYSHKYTKWAMPQISQKKYDLAISFLTPHYFVAEKVWSKKKIAWIHTDYSKVSVDVQSQFNMWNQYDNIISISDSVTESFLKKFPNLKDKIQVIENMMAVKCIERQKNEFTVKEEMPDDGCIKILSIGRFCTAKNFDNVPDICSRIIKLGCNIKWYLIGFGGDEELIRKKIVEAHMEKYVIILGKKSNPYPYIKECDLYIQPSRYEGNSVSVHEAQFLKKPVIITNYSTAGSQLNDKKDGFIVPLDNQNCAKKIVKIIKNNSMIEDIVTNLKKEDHVEKTEVEKIYKYMDGSGE